MAILRTATTIRLSILLRARAIESTSRGVTEINSFADVLALVPLASPNTILIDASNSLTLNVPVSSLQASDFIFNGQVAITVQTPDGYNFGTLYDDMAGSIGDVTVVDGSHFTATNSARGLVFSVTVSGDATPGDPLTGHVNAIDIYDLTGHILATSNGWNFLASDLNNALTAYHNDPAQTRASMPYSPRSVTARSAISRPTINSAILRSISAAIHS